MVQQGSDSRPVVGSEYDDDHHFAGRSGTDGHVAHQPRMLTGIVERIPVLDAETFGFEPDSIRRFGLQPAQADVQHFVEHIRNMESGGRPGLDFRVGGNLLARQPTAVSKGEFQFVAVEPRLSRTEAWSDFGQLDFTDAGQLVAHLIGFESQLFIVGQVLPLATAANAEMFAKRLDAYVGRFCQAFDMPLGISSVFTVDFYVGYVARRAIRDKKPPCR